MTFIPNFPDFENPEQIEHPCFEYKQPSDFEELPHPYNYGSFDGAFFFDTCTNSNVQQGFGYHYEYNDANKLSRVCQDQACSQVVAQYWYDHEGNRVKKVEGGKTTYYVNDYYEETDGESTLYYWANGERVAKKNSSGVFYYLKDHLGSTNVIVDSNGNEVARASYTPFGELIGGAINKYLYTDQEYDPETGLHYYGARYYNPELKRFVQPDPIVSDPYNPQDLNRYTYVRNNPLRYIDPEGTVPIDTIVDVAFTAYDIISYAMNPSEENVANLKWSIGASALPYVPGRWAKKGLKYVPESWIIKNIARVGKHLPESVLKKLGVVDQFVVMGGKRYHKIEDAYEIAQKGGKHSGLIKTYKNKPSKSLKSGIKTFEERIQEHERWIKNPKNKWGKRWDDFTAERKQRELYHWKTEIQTFKEEMEVLRGMLKDVGGL